MHRHLLFTAATVLLLLPTASSLSAGKSLSNCSRTFRCGDVVNVSYPFTGGDRPSHCSPPEFRLSCASYPELTVGSLIYNVKALDQTSQSLTLARADAYDVDSCLQQYANTTLNSNIFTVASDREVLTLFYKCSNLMNINPNNQFTCWINGSGFKRENYYLIGAVPTDPILNGSKCEVSATVPIQPSVANKSTIFSYKSFLPEALTAGFEVNYTNPYEDHCVMCGGIGGECGFDSDQGKPICICGDHICSTSTPEYPVSPFQGSNKRRKLIIGGASAIGASIFAMAIIFTGRFYSSRTRKMAKLSN